MTGTALTPADQAIRIEEHERRTLERDAKALAMSNLVPEYFRGKPEDVLIAGLALRDLGVRLSVNSLCQVYVVKGRPGFMAQLQIALARRHGIDIQFDQAHCNERTATVEIRDRNGWHSVTFTMADAIRAKLPSQNPTYGTYPDRMLLARAVTKAIGVYAPEVKFGFDAAETLEIVPMPLGGDGAVEREAASPPAPAPTFASEPAKRGLLALIDTLDEPHKARLRAAGVERKIPRVDGPLFTVDHLAEMLGLVDETSEPATDAPGVPGSAADGPGAGREPQAQDAAGYTDPLERPFD